MIRNTVPERLYIASVEYLTKPGKERATKWLIISTMIGRYHKTNLVISTATEGPEIPLPPVRSITKAPK
jgi:hypothetical protein